MTIAPGQDWGTEVDAPPGPWDQGDEADLARFLQSGSTAPFAVTRGELFEVLGRPRSAVGCARCRQLSLDMIEVTITSTSGQRSVRIASEAVIRHTRRRGGDLLGDLLVVTNLGRYRGIEFSPRAHPNDGRLEVLRLTGATLRQRLIAYTRFRSHNFVSTDTIRVAQTTTEEVVVQSGYEVLVDGVKIHDAAAVSLNVRPDCASVYVGLQ